MLVATPFGVCSVLIKERPLFSLTFLRKWVALGVLVPCAAFAADPQITSLIDNPDPVPAGGLYTYTIGVDNNASDDATNVVLTFTVPSGASFVSASPSSQNCVAQNATTVQCGLGTVAGQGLDPRSIVLTWRATVPGPSSISANAVLTADNDTNPANNNQSQTTTVLEGADLGLTASGSPTTVNGGSNVTYTLTVTNAGPNSSGDLVVTNTLSPSVTYVSSSGSGWSCTPGSGTVSCTHAGPHPVGTPIAQLQIVATVNAAGGTITHSATVARGPSGTDDPDNSNNTATVNTQVVAGADLSIASVSVTSAVPGIAGQNAIFLIQPRNLGPASASGVAVTANLPAGWTYVSASGPNWVCGRSGQVVSCGRGTLPVGATDDITITALAPSSATVGATGTTYNVSAGITTATADPNNGNNNGSVSLLVLPDGADLTLTKTKSPNPVALGSNLTSRINVSNNGPRTATGTLRVIDVLSGETFVSASPASWTCSANGSVVTCDHANAGGLAVGASLPELVIVTTANAPGTLTNTACTGNTVPPGGGAAAASPPAQGDPNPGNDCATANATSTVTQPDLSVSKTTSTPTGGDKLVSASESSVTYTVVVTNASAGAQDATGITLSDTVPAFISGQTGVAVGTISVSAGNATFNCGVVNGTVNCSQISGRLQQGQSVSIPITVSRPMLDGTFTNNVTVSNVTEGDPNPSNNTASDTVTIAAIADVQMTGKTATPSAIRAGETTTYVLSFRNNGPSTAANVSVNDVFTFPGGDSGLTVVSIASSKGGSTCSIAAGAVLNPGSNSFICTIGSLTNGEAQSITLVVRPNFQAGNGSRTFTNVATVTTTTAENTSGTDNGNNSQSASLTVNPASLDLLVNTTDIVDPVPYSAGSTFLDYRVRVTSAGPSFGTNVRISETMTPPAGKRVRFVCDVTAPGGSTCNATSLCTVSNVTSGVGAAIPAFFCSVPAGDATTGAAIGELASGQSKDIFLRFEVLDVPASNGDVFNVSSTVSSNEPDSALANNTEGEATTTRQRVDLHVTKSSSAPGNTASMMQPFNWLVTVVNNGPGSSLQTDLTDTLPVGAQLTGPVTFTRSSPAGTGSCTVSGRVISCSLGQLDAAANAVVTVPVRFTAYPAGGTAINTATVDTDPLKTGGIDFPGGSNTGTHTMTITHASISGIVFEDRVRDGGNGGTPQSPAVEPRIPGVTITLTGNDAYGNPVLLTRLTDANGGYAFNDLAPSDGSGYTVTETQPANYTNCPVTPNTASPNASYSCGGYSGNSVYSTVILLGNTVGTGFNFPEVALANLSGFVYVDNNANGVYDAGTDSPIVGATVRLLSANTLVVIATTTTDVNGAYRFANLDPYTLYTLEQPLPTAPAGLGNGPVNAGLVAGAVCPSGCVVGHNNPVAGTDRIEFIDLSAGVDGTQFNFGENLLTAISGTVYVDKNRNDTFDGTPTDAPLPNVTLRLVQGADCTSGTTLQTVLSDINGGYAFSGVTSGAAYLICETQPVGYGNGTQNPGTAATSTQPNVISIAALPAGGSTGNHFAERFASIAGSVYADLSAATPALTNNGVRDVGELGIGSVPVTLSGNDINGVAVSLTVTTDSNGNYLFDGLLQSDASGYTVTEGAIPPASGAFTDGKEHVGSAGGSAAVNDVISGIVLAAGTQATAYDFGELPLSTISGTVYLDRNRNNLFDGSPTDAPLPGVTLRLVQGASCAAGTVLQTVVSDVNGGYLFTAVSAGGDYLLCETQPVAYANGVENPGPSGSVPAPNTILITNLPLGGSAGNHFGERGASLAGTVFLDANNDGARQGGENGIASVTITLTGNDVLLNPISRTATTDSSGNFRFDDLPMSAAGGYQLTEQAAQPQVLVGGSSVTTLNGRTTAGTVPGGSVGSFTPVGTTPSVIGGITLPAGADGVNFLFAEILPVAISGTVFVDINNNGVQDPPADIGLNGVTLVISGTDDTGAAVSRNVTTLPDGSFSLSDLRPGTYTITEPTQPPGTSNGQTLPGTGGGTGTAPNVLPSAIGPIVLTTPGAGSSNNRFAEIANTSSISGKVWLDSNANGLFDGAEKGISGVTLTLAGVDLAGNVINQTTSTDANGNYSFTALTAGTYVVTEPTQPAGTVNGMTKQGSTGGGATIVAIVPSVISSIVVPVGGSSINNDFAELPAAEISGRVFSDSNNNGVLDGAETGLAAVPLVLTGTDDLGQAVNLTVNTQADGTYLFPSLRAGTYTVTEPTQPAGTVNGITTAGSSGGTATNVATTPSAISAVVLAMGAKSQQNNFAEVGFSPDLLVSKAHVQPRFTVGHTGNYNLNVRNAGQLPTTGDVVLTDRLPTGLTLAALPTGTGWTCTGAVGGSNFSCRSSTVVAAGASHPGTVAVVVNVGATAQPISPVNNVVMVEGGGEIEARSPTTAERDAFTNTPASLPLCALAISHNACRDSVVVQLAASISGTVWFDVGGNARLLDSADHRLPGWLIEVVDTATNKVVGRATSLTDGTYKVSNLEPGLPLAVRFRDPQSNVVFGYPVNGEVSAGSSGANCDPANAQPNGRASSCVGTGASPQLAVILAPGQDLPQQSLPVDPSGVVYDSALRQAIPGSVVTLTPVGTCAGWDPANQVVGAGLGGYTVAGNAISMTTGNDGLYQFLFAPSAPASCTFALSVTPPAGYVAPSTKITPATGPLVPTGGVGSTYRVQPQAGPPTGAVGPDTLYYLQVNSGSAGANIVHNHIPLDPQVPLGLNLSKTGDKLQAEVGDTVRYTVTVQLTAGTRPRQITVVDRLPAGFTYVRGTAMLGDVLIADPVGGLGPQLAFNLGAMPASGQLVLHYRLRVGVGSQQGDGTNRARGHACGSFTTCLQPGGFTPVPGSVPTNEGQHKVRVTGGVFTTDACFAGKVFVDCNNNHVQDPEELGIPGVRLVLQDGTNLISDSEGKYSLCGLPPRSHVLKVDALTLPRGSRLTTSSNRNLGDANSLWLD